MTKKQLPLFPSQPTAPSEISKHTPLSATFDHFKAFLIKEGKSEHTVKAFIGDMLLLQEFLGIEMVVGKLTTTILNDYLDWMENKRGVACSRKTYARRVTSLKVYFKWLRSLNAIPHDPALAVLQRSGPAPLNDVLTPTQIQAVTQVARLQRKGDDVDYRPEFLFLLLLETGIKKGETGRLEVKDIDRSNVNEPSIIIRHKANNIYKERRLPVSSELIGLLDQYLIQYHPKDFVFTCTTRNLEYILTDLGKSAEIPFKISFEAMRWTSAVRDWRAGIDEDHIREKLGLSQTSWYETSNKIRQLISLQVKIEEDF